ncbi:MAG: hypothetical protein A2X63_09430 [Ignavibacteria bacterium GWA2_35_8]|nr:MAG: hypothetical protein A2X63_09430 [Ignavibacteria bacterium GWA2_35_8]
MQGPKLSNIFTPYIKNFDSSNPIIISPYEVFQFNVKFHPHDDLIYYDTIYFTSNSIKSGFFDSVAVLSGIGKKHIGAIIDVSDADFGSVCRYTKKYLPVTIRNDGDTNLFIIDYQLPVYYLFEPVIKHTINKNNPFIIQPNDSWTFNVLFSAPDITCIGFTDKITFTSNAVSGDSTAVLTVDSVVITGIDDFSYYQDELKITPNPFSNQITLDMTGNNKPETIIINDIFGRTVLTKHTEFLESGKTYNLRLTTDDLPPGVYFVRMSGSHSSRMMVKTE